MLLGQQCSFITVCVWGYLKHLQQSFLLDLQPLKRLLFLDYFFAQVLQTWEVVARYAPVQNRRLVKTRQSEQQELSDNLERARTHSSHLWISGLTMSKCPCRKHLPRAH